MDNGFIIYNFQYDSHFVEHFILRMDSTMKSTNLVTKNNDKTSESTWSNTVSINAAQKKKIFFIRGNNENDDFLSTCRQKNIYALKKHESNKLGIHGSDFTSEDFITDRRTSSFGISFTDFRLILETLRLVTFPFIKSER